MPQPLLFLLIIIIIPLLAALFFWPEKGLLSSWLSRTLITKKVLIEDALKSIQRFEFHAHPATFHSIAGALKISLDKTSKILTEMSDLNLIEVKGNEIKLTSKGFDLALRITRAHRLLEEFLAQETSLPFEEIHKRADKIEHTMTDKELEELSLQLGNPSFDPHGHPIPTASGKIRQMKDQSLITFPVNQTLQIAHLEDEPEEVYAQLDAEGLHPGMYIHLVENSQNVIRFWSKLGEHILTPLIAVNISVVPVSDKVVPRKKTEVVLSELPIGEQAKIKALSPRFRKNERRRLMDLGFIPGTTVRPHLQSFRGDPTAFFIRGSLIALRQEQTDLIEIEPVDSGEEN